jgi:hypothetical protein
MISPRQPATDDEIREVLRRGRFEDLSVLTAIGAMVSIIVVVFVIQLGGPANLLYPAIGILCAVGILAAARYYQHLSEGLDCPPRWSVRGFGSKSVGTRRATSMAGVKPRNPG